jgi:nitrogen regulatory protein PII-like uncharacterized protein
MELDELKTLWNQYHDQQTVEVDRNDIHHMLKGRSSDALGKIRRNLLIEAIIGFISTPLFVYFALNQPLKIITLVSVFLAILLTGICGLYLFKYRELGLLPLNEYNLKENLEALISRFKQYQKQYYWINMLFMLALFIPALIIGISIKANGEVGYLLTSVRSQLILGGIYVLAALLMHPYILWVSQCFYGKHVDKITSCLNELNTQEQH